ncbi:MAG: glutamyl-tRNA reductase [Ignavibacteria bacterium]|jgi:glutamyl-tRNA reductase|nr:glutamyl-tRNA reductase [Ignavibacteria bacterium]MCU7503704.1 glutamyl-tRNA reductase [Ignavibacteria bacterium]MCU7517649.1 glutamyl-tRNA reductase [Ignavibacteria bacterium]
MNLLAVSINHRTAPVELRESLHLSTEEIKSFLKELKGNLFSEGFIISTCNRTEIYGFPINPRTNFKDLQKFLMEMKPVGDIRPDNFQNYFSCGAVNHLFRVSAGIDSLLLGDNQILGQVKESFQISEEFDFAGFLMKRIFDSAIKVGKRAKTETIISDGAITVSYAAVQLIEKIFSSLSRKSALVIGTGETGEIAAKHLRDKGIGTLSLTNRTMEKAEKLASAIHANAIPFSSFRECLHDYDIIISATSAPDLILTYDDVRASMKKRNGAPTIMMDIAIPRDIDPSIRELDSVFYHDIDSLKIIVDQNVKKRQGELPKVQSIIMEELVNLFGWYNSLEVTPTIRALRQVFEDIRLEEVDKIKNKLNPEDVEKLEMVTKRIINKLLHQPTVELKRISENGVNTQESAMKVNVIRSIFGLDHD